MNRPVKLAAVLAAGACLCLAQMSLAEQDRQQTRNRGDAEDRQPMSDRDFVKMALSDGLAEVNLGRMALEQATNPETKRFAQRLIDDHIKANQELNRVANKMGITPPTTIDEKHRALADRLMQMRGADFDRAFAKAMVHDHDRAIRVFEMEAKNGQNRDLQELASKTVPTLREHLKIAKDLAAAGRNGAGTRDRQ